MKHFVATKLNSKLFANTESHFSTSFHFLRLFLKYTYILRISPFRINETSSGFQLESHKLQKVFCAFLHLSGTAFSCYFVYKRWPHHKIMNSPWLLFKYGLMLSILSYFPVLCYSLWFKQDAWLKVFRECEQQQQPNPNSPNLEPQPRRGNRFKWNLKHSIFMHILVAVPTVPALLVLCSGHTAANWMEKPEFLNETWQERDRSDTVVVVTVQRVWTTIASILEVLLISFSVLVASYVEATPSLAAVVLRHLSLEFEEVLNDPASSEDSVFRHYLKIKKIVDHLNSALSSIIMANLCTGIVYYSLAILLIFDSDDVSTKVGNILATLVQFGVLFITAAAAKRINKIKRWMIDRDGMEVDDRVISVSGFGTRSASDASSRRLLMYTHICDEPIALKCASLFTITDHSLGTGLGLLATYTIITLQLYSTPSVLPPSTD